MEEAIGNKETLIYDIARLSDVPEVAEFASEYFFNSSPIRELASFDDPTDEAGQFAWRQGRLQKCFTRPTSIIVREKTSGEVVAFQAAILEDRENKPLSNDVDEKIDHLVGLAELFLPNLAGMWISTLVTQRIEFSFSGSLLLEVTTGKERCYPLTESPIEL